MSDETTTFSAARLADLIRRRELSPVEVVGAHLRRIETLNPTLNAVVTLAPDALERAREAEQALMKREAVGALHGVPVTVKDTIDVRGLRATAGSRLREDFVPDADATAVTRLRAAGAIILGKTNCSEMALDYTAENPVFGRTLNPHDPSLSPGGSSGGCASAVAARLTPASLGSDLSGSVRIPANFCGVLALRPTAGRVPTDGHCPPVVGPYELGASFGPLARRVEDLGLLFEVLSGTPRDATPSGSGADALRGLRFAWYADDGITPASEEVRAGLARAVEALRAAGLEGVEARPPGVDRATGIWMLLFSRATTTFLREAYAGRVSEAGALAHPLVWRSSISDVDGPEPLPLALKGRERLRAELLRWMETRPLLVAPVGAVPAFRHEDVRRKIRVGGKRVGIFHTFGYAQAFNVFDLPAAAVPTGRTPEGIPLGVQIIGRPFREDLVLAAARVLEESLGGWLPPRENLSHPGANQL